jgi:hypothetical protein
MPEALSSMMRGAMDWAYRSAFRLFAAAPWPPRFRGAVRLLPMPIARAWGHVRDWLSVFFGLPRRCLQVDARIQEQRDAKGRNHQPRRVSPEMASKPRDMCHGALLSQCLPLTW